MAQTSVSENQSARPAPVPSATRAGTRGPRGERGAVADRILTSARQLFAERGYASTSIRQVAEAANVDTALVSYYFVNKAGLLDAVVTLPVEFVEEVALTAGTPLRSRAKAIVSHHLRAWQDPKTAAVFSAILRAASDEPAAMKRLREVFAADILSVVSSKLAEDERLLRSSLISSQLIGLAMTRQVWKIGALADLPAERVIQLVAPTIQRYLTGPID